ncbi:Smr/MutS family protein [Gramella sp. AN32]|uniref:Smr/MutS family protein n=1 Tax=Christiangramia antarctica TaxID=2058158 RepID=A0ABW5X470_9FLAO|nr:Smr/MutS family protein [Gramella sp. AN32]MCM4158002.1 DNA mismatch repair protein MutS [Gramella sp. AN32]
MKIEIGDFVSLLDDDLSGTVEEINGSNATIKTTEGFSMEFPLADMVKIEDDIDDMHMEDHVISEIIKEKTQKKNSNSTKNSRKEKGIPPMEVDLHINQLIRSTRSMNAHEILNLQLDTARHKLEFAIKKRIQKIVFIHGVGEGVLKMELEYLLGRYGNIKYYDADYQKYGLGATEVYIFQNP